MICGEHQVYKQCEKQEKTCSDPNAQVPSPCVVGCYCNEGYVKAPNGQCVRLEECPQGPKNNENVQNRANNTQETILLQEGSKKNEYVEHKPINTQDRNVRMHSQEGLINISPEIPSLVQVHPMFGVVIYDSQPSHHDPSVEDCASDEEYFSCGWCEPSCSDPSPNCPSKVCIRGCLCRPPLLRHHSGHCVDVKDCHPEKCNNPNEEYVCLFGCELRCDGVCQRPRYCVLGCYCRLGLLRDNNGLCVIKERCSNSTDVQGRPVNYDRSTVTVVNYERSPSVNHHRSTNVDFEKILGNDETFILVPIM